MILAVDVLIGRLFAKLERRMHVIGYDRKARG
jgi:hypothetical protein